VLTEQVVPEISSMLLQVLEVAEQAMGAWPWVPAARRRTARKRQVLILAAKKRE